MPMENKPATAENGETGCGNTANGGINHLDSTPHASGNAANQAGSSFSQLPEATTFEEQLTKMEGRGLAIEDRGFAIAKLRDLNYYRLRGYWLTLEDGGSFTQGTSFGDIWEVYQLDRELRRWLWQAVAPIEIKLRTQFAYEFAHRCGADAYLDEGNYWRSENFERALKNYERERDRAYRQGVPYVVHNIAAHHDRFYNRVMNIRPTMLRRDTRYAGNKQFPTLIIIKRIYEKSWPEDWKTLGSELAACFDRHLDVNLAPMGMASDWKRVLGIS